MRTTLSIDDDLLPAVKSLASTQRLSMSTAVSALIRAGLKAQSVAAYPQDSEDEFPTFQVSENAKILTLEDVKRVDEEI